MKFKVIIISAILTLACSTVYGQLMERENVNSKIKTATRPEKGNFGFYLSTSIVELEEMFNKDIDLRGVPLMNLKYYYSDRLEIKLGTQIYNVSEKIIGTLDNNETGREDDLEKETFLRFIPGVNYHFSSLNFVDSYIGLGVILGTERSEVISNEVYNATRDFYNDHYFKKTFVWGFNINFGMQAFIADLPISVGVEFGISGLKHDNLHYEHKTTSSVGGVITDQTYYTINESSLSQYKSLEYEKFEIGGDLRFTISYYFRK